MDHGTSHLRERLHNLQPSQVRFHASGGMLADLALFDVNEDVLYWLRARRQAALGWMGAIRSRFDELDRKVELCGIPRSSASTGCSAPWPGDAERVVAWVSTGRHPHSGDAMPGRDLRTHSPS